MSVLKNPGNTTLTWLLKLPNRIRALLPNLALGMKTHKAQKKAPLREPLLIKTFFLN